jgi:hypothetical protein
MKVLTAFAVLLLSLAPTAAARTVRLIELRGNARILSADVPVRKGRLYLFHHYPDGVYMSVPAEDVLGIATTTAPDPVKTSDAVDLGPTGEGQPSGAAVAPSQGSSAPGATYDQGSAGYYGDYYGDYYGGCYGCTSPPIHPGRPGPLPPALVGPNGFPLLPGSPPPAPIGPNGFPILAPPPRPALR